VNLIVCLDDKDGMSFFGRRQSMDRALRERALALAGEAGLWMDAYSAGQFSKEDRITVVSDFREETPPHAWYFLETGDIAEALDRAEKVAVFRWNRLYPSDRRFPYETLCAPWRKTLEEEFPGHSHEKITLEVYEP